MLALGLQWNSWCCEHLSSHSFYIELEERQKVRRSDTTQPWGSTKSRQQRVRSNGGKDRVCVFVVWQDEMKMRCCKSTAGSPEYILCIAHCTSVTPASPYNHRRYLTIYLVAVIKQVWWCAWRPAWSELRDALGGRDRASLDMHLEAEIEWTERCTLRLWLSKLGDALAGYDRATLEKYLEMLDLEGGATAAETIVIV